MSNNAQENPVFPQVIFRLKNSSNLFSKWFSNGGQEWANYMSYRPITILQPF